MPLRCISPSFASRGTLGEPRAAMVLSVFSCCTLCPFGPSTSLRDCYSRCSFYEHIPQPFIESTPCHKCAICSCLSFHCLRTNSIQSHLLSCSVVGVGNRERPGHGDRDRSRVEDVQIDRDQGAVVGLVRPGRREHDLDPTRSGCCLRSRKERRVAR